MKIIQIIIAILIAHGAGLIGAVATAGSVSSWYTTINKPSFNPPDWVFGPVWLTLYTVMGIASFLVWRKRDMPGAGVALGVYGMHLALNSLWSILFFGLQNPGWALVEIFILWLFITATIFLFYRINKTAGLLLLPYLLWVSFASVLNFYIWKLN